MSISQIQRRRMFEEVTRTLFSSGERPRLIDIMREVSEYFSEYPTGLPLPTLVTHIESGLPANVEKMNQMLAHVAANLDVLYEVVEDHQQDIMMLTTLLRTNLERLRARRKRLMTQIDDYLFSLYNTDGYYYSISDVFSDLSMSDLDLTTAYVDTYSGHVTLPTVSHLTKRLETKDYGTVAIEAIVDNTVVNYDTTAPFQGCVDGLTNTIWSMEVERSQPEEVLVHVALTLGSSSNPIEISKIEFDPYGITPVQLWIETEALKDVAQEVTVRDDFGSKVQTSVYKMTFVDQPRVIRKVHFWMRKTEPDYTIVRDKKTKYKYIFAAKEINMTEHVYDNEAVFVSQPLSLAQEIAGENVIDAVSLVATDNIPTDTSIQYYVAVDVNVDDPELNDFIWYPIDKIDTLNPKENSIIRFDGAAKFVKNIRAEPEDNDLLLKPIVTTGPPANLNPNPEIIPTVDIYRLASFSDDALIQSMVLEEGVNTTRILHVDPEDGIEADTALDLAFWKDYRDGTLSGAETIYGRIDTGDGFFAGGDVGEHNKYIYIETYLESIDEQETMLKKFVKADSNSQVWDARVFLNGREVGNLPIGVDELVIPWKFQKGLNHIAVTLSIPRSTGPFPQPQNGIIELFGDSYLYEFGTVKLSTWNYVDPFKMQHNETGQPFTFTIFDEEIVSRRKPTDNFRLKYSKARNSAPDAIRLRADLKRSVNNQFVSPYIDLYRLRFIYS